MTGKPMTQSDIGIVDKLKRFAATGRERRKTVVLNGYHADALDEAAAIIMEMVEALEPFARIANHCAGEPDETILYTHQGLMGDMPLTIGDFKRAAKVSGK